MQTVTTAVDERRVERACFDGMLVAALAYGALLMVFVQLIQVLLTRPKRGRIFWGIIAYSIPIFLLATIAIGGRFKFAEMMYIERGLNVSATAYYYQSVGRWENVLNQACTIILPWIGDLLMIYRLYVLWNYQWWILCVPGVIHLGRTALSIPLLIAESRPHDPRWALHIQAHITAYYALSVTVNLLFTVLIAFRLFTLRSKVEQVTGKVQAVYYTSPSTTFVESGAFFTLWSLCYVILLARGCWIQDVFLQPAVYVNGITRMLIILRMAQNQAWSRDIVTASATGILDWQVSSSHSLPLHETQSGFASQHEIKNLPKKFREDVTVL